MPSNGHPRTPRLRRWIPRRTERGVTLVEYALVVAVFAVPTIAAVDLTTTTAKAKFADTATRVGQPYESDGGGTAPTTTEPPAPTTTSTTTTSTTTSTTTTTTVKPTTTTTSTTTTTVKPTTTTTTVKPTTTTTVKPSRTSGTLAAVSVTSTSNDWRASTTLTVKDNLGSPVVGADVKVKVRTLVVDKNNKQSWKETTVSGTTGSGGSATIDSGSLKRSGSNRVIQVEFVLVDVDADDLNWDGTQAKVAANAP